VPAPWPGSIMIVEMSLAESESYDLYRRVIASLLILASIRGGVSLVEIDRRAHRAVHGAAHGVHGERSHPSVVFVVGSSRDGGAPPAPRAPDIRVHSDLDERAARATWRPGTWASGGAVVLLVRLRPRGHVTVRLRRRERDMIASPLAERYDFTAFGGKI
jgi:hypothetical protein